MSEFLIVCPLQSELRPFLEGISELGLAIENQTNLKIPTYHVPSKGLVITTGGHGKVQFGVQSQYLLSNMPNIKGMICVGAGGGLDSCLKVGDLVIAERTIEHDYTEKFDRNARLPEFHAHPTLIEKFKTGKLSFPFKIHFGSVASGDEDIVDPVRAEELYLSTQSLAVAWEGTGGARACKFNEVPFLEMRVITDNARESVPESFAKNLNQCMKNVARFLCETI